MTETDADLAKALERFDKGVASIEADPEGFRRKVEEELIAEYGQEWFDEHKAQLDADFEGASALLGF